MLGFFKNRKHNKLRELLSAYVDVETTESETIEVEGHLGSCDLCVAELESLRGTVNLLRSLPELEIPRSFVLTQAPAPVRTTKATVPRLVWSARFATSFAAVMLLALVLGDVTGLLTQSDSEFQSDFASPAASIPASQPESASQSELAGVPGLPGPSASQDNQDDGDTRAFSGAYEPQPPAQPLTEPSQQAPLPSLPDGALETQRSSAQLDASGVTAEAVEPPTDDGLLPSESTDEKLAGAQPTPNPASQAENLTARPSSGNSLGEDPNDNQNSVPTVGLSQNLEVENSSIEDARLESGDDGLMIPLWQLQIAAGSALVLLASVTYLMTRRTWRA